MRYRTMTWLVGGLVLALAAQAGAQDEKEYMAVLLDGRKIGYAEHTRKAAGGKVTTSEVMELTIGRAGTGMTVRQSETSIETEGGKPLGFASLQDIGLMTQKVEGKVEGGKVTITPGVGGQATTKTMDWPQGAVLAEGARLIEVAKGLKEGTSYTIKAFSPSLLQALDTETTVGGSKEVDLFGRVVTLTEVRSSAKGPTGKIDMTGYVDDQYNARKVIAPMMGMSIILMASFMSLAFEESPVGILLRSGPLKRMRCWRRETLKNLRPGCLMYDV